MRSAREADSVASGLGLRHWQSGFAGQDRILDLRSLPSALTRRRRSREALHLRYRTRKVR
jgi:hypothetical protein